MIEKGGGVLMISAPPGSGKSNFLVNLFLRETLLKDEFEGGLYLISPTAKSDLSSEALVNYADFVETEMSEELLEGIYSNIMSVPKEDRLLSCVIMDDCMGSNAMKQHTILNKMISSCRHLKTLFVFSTQAVKSINPNLRSCLSHSIVFYQPSSKQLNDVIELHSFMGGEEMVRTKITSYSARDLANEQVLSNIKNNIENDQDVFFRGKLTKVELDNTFPQYVLNNLSKYSKMIKA